MNCTGARSRSLTPSSDGGLSWEEVNFAEYEEVSDDDLRDAVVVGSRGRPAALSRDDALEKTCSLSTEESESPTISSRDGSQSPLPHEVQYFDLAKSIPAPRPNDAARIVQAWWRTLRCPTIHLPDEDDDIIIEELATPVVLNEGIALRAAGAASQWDLWERQMEEDMPLIWENLDRRWLIYTMLLWLVLTMFSNPFQFHVPMAVANSSANAGQASKTPVVQSKSAVVVMNTSASWLLLLPKRQLPNFGPSFANPFYLKGNSTISVKTPQALVIKVKHFMTPLEADAGSAWLSEARVRWALGPAKPIIKAWVMSKVNEPSLWPWSFPSPHRPAVAGLLPAPKPTKQGMEFKVWWWLLGEKVAGELGGLEQIMVKPNLFGVLEPAIKLCTPALTSPAQVPLLTWTPKQKIQTPSPVIMNLILPPPEQLRIAPKLLPIVRPSTSLTTLMFFNQWQPEYLNGNADLQIRDVNYLGAYEMTEFVPAPDCVDGPPSWDQMEKLPMNYFRIVEYLNQKTKLPMIPMTPLRTQVDVLALQIYENATQRKEKKERRDSLSAKRLQKGLRKAKKRAETILEKSRMQALHHLEKARKAFEKKVAFSCLAGSCLD